jgi:hypothetical protein
MGHGAANMTVQRVASKVAQLSGRAYGKIPNSTIFTVQWPVMMGVASKRVCELGKEHNGAGQRNFGLDTLALDIMQQEK